MRWAIAMLLVAAGCDAAESESAPVAAAAAVAKTKQVEAKAEVELGGTLRALALVNEPDVTKARPYRERHVLIDQLEATADARRIDRRLNLALDLRQAGEAAKPCEAYRTALARIEGRADAYFEPHVRDASPPEQCEAAQEREAVLAMLGGEADPDGDAQAPADDANSRDEQHHRRHASRRHRRRGKSKSKDIAPPIVDAEPARDPPREDAGPGVAKKIDEELKPFGL